MWETPEDVLSKHQDLLESRSILRSNSNKSRRELWCVARYLAAINIRNVEMKTATEQADSADVIVRSGDGRRHKFQVVEATSNKYQKAIHCEIPYKESIEGSQPGPIVELIESVINSKINKKYSDSGELNLLVYFNNRLISLNKYESKMAMSALKEKITRINFLSISVLYKLNENYAVELLHGPKIT